MPPTIHPNTIDQVKQQIDIVDLVSERVVLRKQGKDMIGLCPFHEEKTPSFSVSPTSQLYYCFSCHAGGDGIKFLRELDKASFSEVVLNLAQRYGVPVETVEPEQQEELRQQLSLREQLYQVLASASQFFQHTLWHSEGQAALDYLTERGFSKETIKDFGLGYARVGWRVLLNHLSEKFPESLIERAGLIVPANGGAYDRFRDRLMIPICDQQGRVIGFGGRSLGQDMPKYINSPETELFDKGKTLFALDKAHATVAKQDEAIVVEGFFDAIALHAAGVTNVVASLGTALTPGQVRSLLRFTESKNVILSLDSDHAGIQAAERVIEGVKPLVNRGDVQLRVLSLPEGKDPDEFLRRRGVEAYCSLVEHAPLWLDWQIERALDGLDLEQADQFQQGVKAITTLLGELPDATTRTHYIHRCAELLGRGQSILASRLEEDLRMQVRGQRWHGKSQKWQEPGDRSLLLEAEAKLLRIYLHRPEARAVITTALDERDLEFSLSHHRALWRQILDLEEAGCTDLLINLEYDNDMTQVHSILILDEAGERDLEQSGVVIPAAVACLERVTCEQRCRHLADLWRGEPENAVYQERLYGERARIEELDRQRQVDPSFLLGDVWG